jgi:hypothetical protein
MSDKAALLATQLDMIIDRDLVPQRALRIFKTTSASLGTEPS